MKALITGANRGIGLEFVKTYLKLNYQVIATVRDKNAISPELSLLLSDYKSLRLLEIDLSNPDSISKVDLGDEELDLLINNAGIIDRTESIVASSDLMHNLFQVNAGIF